MQTLTATQLEFFLQEGYLMIPDVFAPQDLTPVREELQDIVHRESLRLVEEEQLEQSYAAEPFETRLGAIYNENPDTAEEIIRAITGRGGGGHSGKALFEVITHPNLLSVMESLIGPEIVGSSVYRIRPKIPGLAKGVVPWHQDSGYFSAHCDRELIVTCWLPLVDATPENGCLQVLPRVHREDLIPHHTNGPAGYLFIPDDSLPTIQPVAIPVPLGGVLLMTNRTPHCSTPNNTNVVRWSLDLRYQSAEVPNNVGELPEDFSADLRPGEIACYPPEADFIVRSPSNPETETKTWEAFNIIRQRYEHTRPLGPKRWQPVSGSA